MHTTAPSKVMGTSGGRTARRTKPDKLTDDGSSGRSPRSSWSSEQRRVDTMNPTSTSYSFMPTSGGKFSRLQLSKSNDASVVSDGVSTTIRARKTGDQSVSHMDSQGNNRSQIPSAMSNASSGSNHTIRAAVKNSGFAAAPEVKTAVVQTWASTQHDLLAADIFSLGAVIMDIITFLCKKSSSSFARHRSARNRNAGRGGGLADARYDGSGNLRAMLTITSFHANIGQVVIWGTQLQTYAADRAKKDDGEVFKALGPIIQLVKRCLEREPEDRLSSANLERRMGEYISSFAGVENLHCIPEPPEPIHKKSALNLRSGPSTMKEEVEHTSDKPHPSQRDQWSQLRSRGLTTATIPSQGPESSLSSLSSFNFDYDVRSDTIVAEDRSVLSDGPVDPELAYRIRPKPEGWNSWHNNDSGVDPMLVPGAPSLDYENHSASISPETADGPIQAGNSFLLAPTSPILTPTAMQPPAPPPTRALPAAPDSRRLKSRK